MYIAERKGAERSMCRGRSRKDQRERATEADWTYAPDGGGFAEALKANGIL